MSSAPLGSTGTDSVRIGLDPARIASRQEFAVALTALREAAGLTVRQVARAAGASPSTVGGYFSGRHLPPLRPDGGLRAVLMACGITDPVELDAWQRALSKMRRAPGPRPGALPPPYRGLAAFRTEDARLFHGRDAETAALADLVTAPTDGITVLLGAAGSGKTSLVNAGLVPLLCSRGHRVAGVPPSRSPLRDVADALVTVRAVPEPEPGQPLTIDVDAAARRPVLVVDAFEDVLAALDHADAEALVRLLAAATRVDGLHREDAGVAVLLVLRTEAVSAVARFPDIAVALRTPDDAPLAGSARTLALGAMDDDALRAAILGPASATGTDVDPTLVEAALTDAADVAGRGDAVLPRLSHALLATWRGTRRGRLTLAAYREAGGVARSVEQAAEAALARVSADARDDAAVVRGALAEAELVEMRDGAGHPPAGLLEGWPAARRWWPEPSRVAGPATIDPATIEVATSRTNDATSPADVPSPATPTPTTPGRRFAARVRSALRRLRPERPPRSWGRPGRRDGH